ncbi:SAM-dependent methyltransferase [Streptomyces tricolor]|nr:SAM-dependent methyltransferase [Streptomyces tricolor]
MVLLGAGLDTRALRLDWPSDRVVFEIDRAGVLAFKQRVLTDLHATPKAQRVPVPVDLRADWVTALTAAGFDPAAPSVWLAEGLLFYLPGPAETQLIDTVDRLTAEGSALAFEAKLEKDLLGTATARSTRLRAGRSASTCFTSSRRDHAPTPPGDLTAKGWSTSVRTPSTSPAGTDAVPSPSRTTRWKATGGCSRTNPGPDLRGTRLHVRTGPGPPQTTAGRVPPPSSLSGPGTTGAFLGRPALARPPDSPWAAPRIRRMLGTSRTAEEP